MTLSSTPVVSVVVPAFNEEGAIEETIDQLDTAFRGVEGFEVVVVDDGSQDGTLAKLKSLQPQYPALTVVEHGVNRGYGAALKTGMRHARSDLIAIIDADGTYPIADLPKLVRLADEYDMVVGARTGHNVEYPLIRKFPKYFLRRWINWIVKTNVPDVNSGMRVFRKEMGQRFVRILPDGFSFTITITISSIRNNYRVLFEPIDYFDRNGRSKIRPFHDTLRFLQIICRTGMYFAPIRILFPVIVLLSLVSFGSLGYDIALKNLTDKTVLLFGMLLNVSIFTLLADMIDKRSGTA